MSLQRPVSSQGPTHILERLIISLFLACNDVIKNINQRYFLTKFLHNVDKLVLKGLCKFQIYQQKQELRLLKV